MVYIGLNRRAFQEVVACRFVARFFAHSAELEPWPQILVVRIAALVISARARRRGAPGRNAVFPPPRRLGGPARVAHRWALLGVIRACELRRPGDAAVRRDARTAERDGNGAKAGDVNRYLAATLLLLRCSAARRAAIGSGGWPGANRVRGLAWLFGVAVAAEFTSPPWRPGGAGAARSAVSETAVIAAEDNDDHSAALARPSPPPR
jgi:hypothetical protein